MFSTGVVSVTFRNKSIFDIILLCAENSLDCIEVGSDVHAPYDDIENCRRIAEFADKNGVKIISYGSYYKLGEYEDLEAEFTKYLNAAKALKTKNIRIWAGVKGSRLVDKAEYSKLVDEAQKLSELAKREDMTISFEYHQNTLTDNANSAVKLMEDIGKDNVHLYWQPNQCFEFEDNINALKKVLSYVSNIHVFAWDARGGSLIRYPLCDFDEEWQKYLEVISSDKKHHALLLEFVKDDSEAQFVLDAKTLNNKFAKQAL